MRIKALLLKMAKSFRQAARARFFEQKQLFQPPQTKAASISKHLEWRSDELLSGDHEIALLALKYLGDQLRIPGYPPDEVDAVLEVLYQRLETAQHWELQEQLLDTIEDAYFNQHGFSTSIAPLKDLLKRTENLFVDRILDLICFSQEREHWDIFQWALDSPSESIRRQAASVIQHMEKVGQWPLKEDP